MSLGSLLSPRGILEVLQRRIADLDDEEMLWEPVPDCLSLRVVGGQWSIDEVRRPPTHFDGKADPVTTIGWRLAHIANGLMASRITEWLGVVDAPPLPGPPAAPASAADGMRAWIADAKEWYCGLVESLGDDHLNQPMGPVAGKWGDAPRAGFLVHVYTETAHHGGEVGVLRDLWRAGLR